MRAVAVDPVARTARVAAGARWADVIPKAAAHGLVGLPGSSSHVGVVGFTMGGGFGWLGRRYGLASGSVRSAEVVTADGGLVTANAAENPDLSWGLAGSGGNLGIVTSLEFALHPVTQVYAGDLFYPVGRGREVLDFWSGWTAALPDEMTSAVAFVRFPPFPTVPAPLRGGRFVSLRGCWCGGDLDEGARLVTTARAALGAPAVDTWAAMPAAGLDAVSMDPVDPLAAHSHSELLRDLSSATIDTLLALGSDGPLTMMELRQLGGALTRPATALSPMAHTDAPFSLNAIGLTPTPGAVREIRAYLSHVAETVRPHSTGATYLNFMDLDGATPQRVRAAYSADDWARLVGLKGRYDPANVFRFNRNIPPP